MPHVIPHADGLTRRPAFWVAYAALAAISLVIAWRLFPLALPLINLDIKLSRQEALAKAEALDQKFQLSPPGSRKAVRFTHDQSTQNYVELEGGGKSAFAALVAGDVYSPYRWEVRLFNPGEVTEALVRFRPDGSVYGFRQTRAETYVPADPTRRALDAEAARSIGEKTARADWSVDLGAYKPIEQTQQQRTSGRVDHVFVYERSAGNLGESRFRLRLGVTGDALSELTYFVHIPESFARRFVELRSANNTIASTASLAAGLLYGLGGCILGVLWLLLRGRRIDGGGATRQRAERALRIRHRTVHRHLLGTPGRSRGVDRIRRRDVLCTGVHGCRRPVAQRVRPTPTAVACVVT
jgi:hypothetical protein